MRTLNPNLVTEKNKLDTASAWLTLVQVQINASTTLYLVPNPVQIVFDGITYVPFPLHIDTVVSDGKGGLSEVVALVSNVDRSIGAFVEQNEMRGNRVRLIAVNSAYLADPTAVAVDETYEISNIEVTAQYVKFTLGHDRLLNQTVPGGRYLRDNCRHIYKDPLSCKYAGALATCAKVLEGADGCRAHLNVTNFGAFPGIPSVKGRLI